MDIRDEIGRRIILLDGAMGTALQAAGLAGGQLPETYNIEKARVVQEIHRGFLAVGSDVVTTNTFGANRLKIEGSGYSVPQLISAAVKNARTAIREVGRAAYVALDIGPTGKLMNMGGGLDFEAVYDLVQEQAVAGKEAGADLIFFETFSDMAELKPGVLAAKEHTDLPVFCSVTFESNGRMLMGTDPESAVAILEDLGADAIGINCSLGPVETIPLIRRMTAASTVPVLVQPNAGLPVLRDGETCFDVDPPAYVAAMEQMLEAGVAIVGGCCGTTTAHLAALHELLSLCADGGDNGRFPALSAEWYEKKIAEAPLTAAAPTGRVVFSGASAPVIAEMDGQEKEKWREALLAGETKYPVREAVSRVKNGAEAVVVDTDVFEGGAESVLPVMMALLAARVKAPLILEGRLPALREKAARYYSGKALIRKGDGQ
jgi:5-methyltetrahydrofolate--homocysteine methyltransferase